MLSSVITLGIQLFVLLLQLLVIQTILGQEETVIKTVRQRCWMSIISLLLMDDLLL